jgi:hypothetical protein
MSASSTVTHSNRRPLRKRPPRADDDDDDNDCHEDDNVSESSSSDGSPSSRTRSNFQKNNHQTKDRSATRHSVKAQSTTPTRNSKKPRLPAAPQPTPLIRRRSSRGKSSVSELAKDICVHRKRVVFITGAGVSVASGVRPFRGSSGVWTQVIWTTATRQALRKDPLK